MSAKAAPAAALRRLRVVLRIIRKPRFLPQSPCRQPRDWFKHYSAFAENQRREDANDDQRLDEEHRLSRPSHSSMDEHDFFWIG